MAKRYSKKARILLFAFLALGVTSLVAGFDPIFVSPIHEGGHLLGCWALGIKVVKIEWTGIEIIQVSGWRQNVVGFMGGFSAVLFLCAVYVLLSGLLKALSGRVTYSLRLSGIVTSFSVLSKAAIMADASVQATGGILEGTSLPIYHQVFGPISFVFIITLAFSCFSLLWQLRKFA